MKDLILVYDCITSGLTAYLFHADGRLLGKELERLTLTLKGRHAQQDPNEWWSALCQTTKRLLSGENGAAADRIAAISFSAQSQVCLCLDAHGAPLYPAITWSDTRSEEVENPISAIPADVHYRLTGLPDEASSSIRKLIWLREKHPEIYEKTYCMLQCKDYLAYRLTGVFCTDVTDASSAHALDISTMDWCTPVLEAAGIPKKYFPHIFPSNTAVGSITEAAAEETCLAPHTPVVIGAGDVLCAAVGAGCVSPGQAYLSLGSSSWLAQCRTAPVEGFPEIINNPHAVPDCFLCFSPMQESGVTFKWLKNELLCYGPEGHAPVEPFRNLYPYTGMEALASQSAPGANGLFFFPHLMEAEAEAPRGMILGLTWKHTRQDMVRAALEGVCFEWKKRWLQFTSTLPCPILTVTGPASKERLWLQLLADILDVPVQNTTLPGTPDAIGAAILAGQAAGLYPDFSQSLRFYQIGELFYPRQTERDFYKMWFEEYIRMRASLHGVPNILLERPQENTVRQL